MSKSTSLNLANVCLNERVFFLGMMVLSLATSLVMTTHAKSEPALRIVSDPAKEEVIFDDRQSKCGLRQFPDAPARAVRQADGEIVFYSTFETNWFLTGHNWTSLQPICATAGRGAENADPAKIDDKYWIEALHTLDGKSFIALGSHEYLGIRHPGHCTIAGTPTNPFPCWYSTITQYFSATDAKHFTPAKANYVVAQPQVPFDPAHTSRVGYFTTSNIVSDAKYRYVFIYTDGIEGQPKGNCLFRSALTREPSKWLGWDGADFTVDLGRSYDGAPSVPHCQPVEGTGQEIRGLLKHRASNTWVAIYMGRDRNTTGVFYSLSSDLFHWSSPTNIIEVPTARKEPDCPSVYRYPSIIDHNAPEPSFETIGNTAYLYSVKIILDQCRLLGRQIVRIPLKVE